MRERRLLLGLATTDWGFNERHLPALVRLGENGWLPGPAMDRLCLVLGDANFAHHAWNQLSGLEEIVTTLDGARASIVATHQPLGRIDELYPELKGLVLARTEGQLETMNRPGAVFAPIGGSCLPQAVVGRVLAAASARASKATLALSAGLARRQEPVLWMSVRSRNRTPVNQQSFLVAIARAFLLAAPGATILIDGFSQANDLPFHSSYHVGEARLAIESDGQAAEAIRLELLACGAPGGGVHVLAGLPIGEAILLAQQATVYVCHHGTLQHKVGWFSSTPGVVHCNGRVLATEPAAWVAAQSEIATVPAYLPAAYVDDVAADHDALARRLRQEDYLIRDIPAAVAFFMDVAGATWEANS